MPPSRLGRPQSPLATRPRLFAELTGHFNTIRPFLVRSLTPRIRPPTTTFVTELVDPVVGAVRVSGAWLDRDPTDVVVVIHGLGGSIDSGYMTEALRAADALGKSALLLNCRGADRMTGDIYHSGLTADLAAALASDELRRAERITILGYSLGGHIALRYACDDPDPRVSKLAAICSPLDLGLAADDFDRPRLSLYRGHVLDGLKEIYCAAYQRSGRGILPHEAQRISKIRQWDDRIVAPRFGFRSSDEYYVTQSVGPILDRLKIPALYVGAVYDPMIFAAAVKPRLTDTPVTAIWDDRAGHLGFGPDFDLGFEGELGLEPQVLSWLLR